jgi:hypothetical protein
MYLFADVAAVVVLPWIDIVAFVAICSYYYPLWRQVAKRSKPRKPFFVSMGKCYGLPRLLPWVSTPAPLSTPRFKSGAARRATLFLLSAVVTAQKGPNAVSGAPLKGVDVKLGKVPAEVPLLDLYFLIVVHHFDIDHCVKRDYRRELVRMDPRCEYIIQ